MKLTLYQRLNDLICLKNTGPVDSLAEKLGVSARQVKYVIKKMRQDCDAPIWFDNSKQSYVYTQPGSCDFKFQSSKKEEVTEAIDEALKKYFSPLVLVWCFLPDLLEQVSLLGMVV
uniref:helix-turn-helix domain-containing protein n=1 Tax=Pedobacter schmidteae TaxID=2201271 RepID=UPI000EAD140A|nr:helix-turn-helix domain-containing protein [Pedobacter schmidteae]